MRATQEDRIIDRRRLAGFLGGVALIVALVGVRLAMLQIDAPGGAAALGATAEEPAASAADAAPIVGFAPGIGIPAVDPIPWTGIVWDPLPTTGIEVRPGQGVRSVVHAGDLLLAQGRTDDPRPVDNPDHLGDVAVVWVSRDGARWDARPIVAGVPPNSVSESTAVAAGPRGIVVGGGVCCRPEAPAMWWSADGHAWEVAAVPNLASGAWIQDLAAGPDGFVAIGGVGERGAIWFSADGRTWRAVDPDAAGLVRGTLSSVAPTDAGFVVVGQDDPGVENADAAIWASVGIEAWQRVAVDDPALAGKDEANLSSIVPFPGGFFAVGGTGTSEDRKQCENLGGARLSDLSDTAFSCGWMREMTWHSADGATWMRADPFGADGKYPPDFVGPPPGRAAIDWTHILAGGPGLVGLQEEVSRDQDAPNTLGIWTSADGSTWTRVADGPLHDANDYPAGFAVDGRRLFVLTEQGHAFIGTVRP